MISVEPGFFPQENPGEPVQGGTLTFAEFAETRSLDPSVVIAAGAAGGNSMVALYDQITRFNPETGVFEPRVAESVAPNDDFTEWTISIRPGINFSDGTPLNADAVVGSMTWYMASHGNDVAIIGPLWEGVEKVDDLTVKITLTDSWATFPSLLSRSLGMIVAPAAIAGDEFEPIGAGAWLPGEYAPGEHLTFKPNPNHWDGVPYLDELRFVWLGVDQTKYESFVGGAVHGAYLNDNEVNQRLADDGFPRYTYVSNNSRVILINHSEGHPGADLRVRQAMALAVDPKMLNDRVNSGIGMYGKTMFAPSSVWHSEDAEVNEFDPEAAAELVEEAKAEGFDGNLQVMGPQTSTEVMLALKALWESVGFTVEVDEVRNVADFITRLYVEKNFSMTTSGLNSLDEDPYQNLFSALDSKATTNVGMYNDPEMDALLAELRETPLDDTAAAQDVLTRMENRYTETVPFITYGYFTPTTVWQEDVYGLLPVGEGLTDFGKAWIQP